MSGESEDALAELADRYYQTKAHADFPWDLQLSGGECVPRPHGKTALAFRIDASYVPYEWAYLDLERFVGCIVSEGYVVPPAYRSLLTTTDITVPEREQYDPANPEAMSMLVEVGWYPARVPLRLTLDEEHYTPSSEGADAMDAATFDDVVTVANEVAAFGGFTRCQLCRREDIVVRNASATFTVTLPDVVDAPKFDISVPTEDGVDEKTDTFEALVTHAGGRVEDLPGTEFALTPWRQTPHDFGLARLNQLFDSFELAPLDAARARATPDSDDAHNTVGLSEYLP